ncbi:MAG: invasion associated locus B family protein [Thiothrix sp.]|nr:invasion associated locus B family protein [Thiothrix sp.]HPQ96153.1 invasion associated locus B family protein [Thiolinea sp.]
MLFKLNPLVLLTVLALPLGQAQAANVQGQKYGDWGGQCETLQNQEQVCYLQQVLSEKSNSQPVMITVLGYGKGKQFPTAIFELPKEVDINQGVQLKVDRYNAVGFKGKCSQTGCRAGFTLDNPLTQQFSKGKQALIAFKKRGQQDPVILPISLKGVAQGLQALRR